MVIPPVNEWVEYKDGMCSRCKATCCHLIIRITRDDLVKLELIKEEEKALSSIQILKKLPNELSCYRTTDQTFELKKAVGGACIYLKDFRCSVYEKRPSVCKNFPEFAGVKKGFCPSIKR